MAEIAPAQGVGKLQRGAAAGLEQVVEFFIAPARVVVAVGGVEVSFLGREDLIRNKRAVGRPRDLADAAELEGD